jgi:hypothetical protein
MFGKHNKFASLTNIVRYSVRHRLLHTSLTTEPHYLSKPSQQSDMSVVDMLVNTCRKSHLPTFVLLRHTSLTQLTTLLNLEVRLNNIYRVFCLTCATLNVLLYMSNVEWNILDQHITHYQRLHRYEHFNLSRYCTTAANHGISLTA